MTNIAMFHSVLGVRPGIAAAAELLRSHGHAVAVIDQYDGRVFDSYDEAGAFVETQGFPSLMGRALEGTAALEEPLVVMGFSNGGGMAQFVASQRPGVIGAVLLSGAIDPAVIGVDSWPEAVPVQIHYTRDDPNRSEDWVQAALSAVRQSGAAVDYFDYPGAGHLFTDPSLPTEYQPEQAAELWPRVLQFLREVDSSSETRG